MEILEKDLLLIENESIKANLELENKKRIKNIPLGETKK